MHIGAMAHHAECGENYSTEIAERVLNQYFDYAVAKAPNSSKAVLLIGGDFLHSDGMEAVTPTSKHVLDQDSRYHKLVYVAVRATRRAISKMLDKHKEIEVQIIPGNHDLSGMIWLRAAMAAFYMDEPRVNVDASPAALHVTQFGKTLLGYCHGLTLDSQLLQETIARHLVMLSMFIHIAAIYTTRQLLKAIWALMSHMVRWVQKMRTAQTEGIVHIVRPQ